MDDESDDDNAPAPGAFSRAVQEAAARAAKALPIRRDRLQRFAKLKEREPEIAEIISELPIKKAFVLLAREPLPKGRKKGSAVLDQEMESELTKVQARGEQLTTAAKRVLSIRGISKAQLKSRADYIVEKFNEKRRK